MKLALTILLSYLLIQTISFGWSYLGIPHLYEDNDFIVIGKITKIVEENHLTRDGYEWTVLKMELSTSHQIRNLYRQPRKPKKKTFSISIKKGDYKVGDFGLWTLKKKGLNYSPALIPKEYPQYRELAEIVRNNEFLYQHSPYLGIWRSEEGKTELYLGESGFGYVMTDKQPVHCKWAFMDPDGLLIYLLDSDGTFELMGSFIPTEDRELNETSPPHRKFTKQN